MRVINRKQFFATVAHRPLRRKQIVGRGFVTYERISGNVLRAINRLCLAIARAADEAATFVRRLFASAGDDFVSQGVLELEHYSFTSYT